MSDAIIEFNDSGIRCFNTSGVTPLASPGYARLLPQQVVTGEQARRHAYLDPQQSFSQFWDQLSLSPLPRQNPLARHNADLAFAHLEQVLQDSELKASGQPAAVILAVPGSYSTEQLSILLGLAKAADVTVAGLVDSALLAAHNIAAGDYWHLDIQLHQLIATPLSVDDQLGCQQPEVFPAMGLKVLQDSWAHRIADNFIRHFRHDPLHSADGEQFIHDQLPVWLTELQTRLEVDIQLATGQGDYQVRLARSELRDEVVDRYQDLIASLQRQPQRRILLSHRMTLLPGFAELAGELLGDVQWLPEQALFDGFSRYRNNLVSGNGEITRVVELPLQQPPQEFLQSEAQQEPVVAEQSPMDVVLDSRVSHVLFRGRAYPLAEQLMLADGVQAADLFRRVEGQWCLQLQRDHSYHHQAEPGDLEPGFEFDHQGDRLTLIEVSGG